MLPRQIHPGSTCLVTRRCTQRKFLLKPTKTTTAIFTYCLAVAAARCRVLVHAVFVASNHVHMLLTDPEARLPEFLAYLNKYVAKAVNAHLGRWENFWATEPPSIVRLVGAEDVLDKLRYLISNPVEAELVPRAKEWPGLLAWLPRDSVTVARPQIFFRADGVMPATAHLELTLPPALAALGPEELERQLAALVQADEARVGQRVAAAGRRFLGAKRVLAQSPFASPRTPAPRRQLSPQVACKSKWHRIEALQRLKAFVVAYREAWHRWRLGARDVVFPAGTYALRVHAGVTCAPAPA